MAIRMISQFLYIFLFIIIPFPKIYVPPLYTIFPILQRKNQLVPFLPPSGHMIYIGEENIKNLTDDIRCFILGGMPGKE